MKRITQLLRPVLVLLGLTFIQHTSAQTISPLIFGQNAWMPDTIGNASACTQPPCVLYGKLHNKWNNVGGSGASIIRFGGAAADRNKPTNYQYLRMIDSIRAKGMEPVIQVPFHNWRYSASQAAALVQYINITKGRNVKYWTIGNEPNLEYSYTTASQVAAYIKPFASAMKGVDPTISIIGPELAWFDKPIIDGLTTPGGAYDITGKDTAGRYYIDVISFHTYPFDGTQTRASMITKLMGSNGLNDNLVYLNSRIASCNSTNNRTGTAALKTAITEANVNWQNSSTDNLNGTGVNSFIGGQFLSEMFGIAMKNNVSIVNMWSVVEGNSTALNIGYIDGATGNKKPAYHHFQMMAGNFSGNYVAATSTQTNVKVFSSQNSGSTTVMIMSEDLSNNFNYTIRLNTGTATGTNSLKVNVNAGIASEYNDVIQNQSTQLLVFDAQGNLVKKINYTLAGHAALNLPPTTTIFTLTSTAPLVAQPVNNTPSGNLLVCSGNSTTLTAVSGSNTVKWYQGATSTVAVGTGTTFVTPALSAVSASTVSYYAEAVASGSVSARTPITVTVQSLPAIAVNSGSICTGNSFTMIPAGAATYTFSSGSAVVSPVVNSSYSVSGTSAAGCVSSVMAVANVTVNTRPMVIVNSGSICAGNSFTIVPSGAVTYTVQNAGLVVSPQTSTVYMVTGTGTNGCVSSGATSSITVSSLAISVNSGTICKGSSFTMVPSGAVTYTFSSGSAVVYPKNNTSYTVTGANATGCTGMAVATVGVYRCNRNSMRAAPDSSEVVTVDADSVNTQSSYPDVTTSVKAGDISAFAVYPNPNNGEFFIETGQEGDITVLDITGAVVRSLKITNGKTAVSIADLPTGIYIVRLTQGRNVQYIKIIRN